MSKEYYYKQKKWLFRPTQQLAHFSGMEGTTHTGYSMEASKTSKNGYSNIDYQEDMHA